jgi:protein SCO1
MSRGFLPLLAIIAAAGTAALAWETDGFRVITTAGARQVAIERTPAPLPDVQLVDQNGFAFRLSDYLGKRILVDFFYSRCPTICSARGDDFQRVRELMDNGPDASIDLLSISFDPGNDDREARKLYGDRFNAKAPGWRIAAPTASADLAVLLKSFGVVVIPDGLGGFVHNDAVYLVDADGRLVRILDPQPPKQLLAEAAGVP